MKFEIFLILFFILKKVKNIPDCLENRGCLISKEFLVYLPLFDFNGKIEKNHEIIDEKRILIFKNKLSIFFGEKSINRNFLARSIQFSAINLDCGGFYSNKLCTAKEFLEKNENIQYENFIINFFQKIDENFDNQCIILPLIDFLNIKQSLLYICQKNKAKMQEFYIFRDKLSKLIDNYQLTMLIDYSSSANSFSHKGINFIQQIIFFKLIFFLI